MAAIIKHAKTVRTHWKKSLFASVLLGYGVKYAFNVHECNQIMHAYCEEARLYGKQTIRPTVKPRHVTLLMNPTANGGKGKILFDKYAAPILHLAGIKVSLVKTESEGQASALMEVMDNTDAVVISGGNGTVQETVTGLLRRNDSFSAATKFPIGIIPVGKTNSLANDLFQNYKVNQARFIAECAIAIVRNTKKYVDVMSVTNDEGNKIFAVKDVEWGVYKDTEAKTSKFWFFGPLKSKVVYLSDAIRNWPNVKSGSLSYTLPCKGCSKCHVIEKDVEPKNTRWWQAFTPRLNKNHNMEYIDYSKILNDDCNIWKELSFKSTNLKLSISSNSDIQNQNQNQKIPSISISIDPDNITRRDYIKEGWGKITNEPSCVKCEHCVDAKIIKLNPEGNLENEWFRIDNEDFEAKSMEVKILPQRVQIYCPKENVIS